MTNFFSCISYNSETVAFRNALVTSVSKVFARIWVGVNHVGQKLRRRGEAALKNGAQKVGEVDALKAHVQKAQRAHVFMSDIVRVLFSNLYPGAPYERRCTALELLNSVVESWKSYGDISGRNNDLIIAKQLLSSPYSVFMQDEAYTSLLMGALVDSWEKMRMTAFKLLRRHASPLAGIETPEKLAKQLEWALELLHSPRVRESGAAALMIRLLIHKYIFELNWNIELSPHVRVAQGHQGENRDSTNLQVLKMLCDLLEQDIYAAEQDIIEGCRRCLAHGAILLAKYTLCDLNFKGDTREHTQVSPRSRASNDYTKGDEENQAPSTDIGEDNGRLNRTINYPGQDRALRIIHLIYHSRHVQGTHIFSLRIRMP